MSGSLFFRPFFGGHWNYWSILFYPLVVIFLFNVKSFSKKELAVLMLILIYFIHFFLMAFNHFMFLELLLLKGHNLFVKLQFIMQLAGGLFIGIVFNKFLTTKDYRKIKGLNLAKIFCYPIILIYGFINLFFVTGILINWLSKNRLELYLQNLLLFLTDNLKALASFKARYSDFLVIKLKDISHILTSHFLNSKFTLNYLSLFASRLIIIFLFLFLIKRLLENRISPRKIIVTVFLILTLFAVERTNILRLYCSFNQDAPKNFSEDYKEIKYLKNNLKKFERVTVVTNDYSKIVKYFSNNYGMAISSRNTLSCLDKEKYYNIWKDFPESYRNGMPLMFVFNLPYEINVLNGLFTSVQVDIWDIYNQINLRSDFYKNWIEANKGVTDGNFDIYNVDSPLVDLLGVKFVLSSIPLDSEKLSFVLKGDKYFLYENKKTFPHVWVVDNYIVEKNKEKILRTLKDNQLDLMKTVIIDNENGYQDIKTNKEKLSYRADIIEYRPNFIQIEARVNKRSILVLSDTYFKDWSVYINGKRGEIKRVDYLLRGVFLSQGKNIIIFDFKPKIFFYSVTVSFISCILVCLYLIFNLVIKKKKSELAS